MRIKNETIEYFKNLGYELRPTLETFETVKEKKFQAHMKNTRNYSPASIKYYYPGLDGEEILKAMERDAREYAERFKESRWWGESTDLYIFKGDSIIRMKNLSKYIETPREKIEKRIIREDKAYQGKYGNSCRKVQKLLRDNQLNNGYSIYPTQYGIGVWVFYNLNLEENLKDVQELLDKNDIGYTTEFSPAKWVFRFRLDKKNELLNQFS